MNSQPPTPPVTPPSFTQKREPPFYNCHTHIFNFEHVNRGFLKGMIPIWVGLAALVLAALLGYFIYEIIIHFLSLNWIWIGDGMGLLTDGLQAGVYFLKDQLV